MNTPEQIYIATLAERITSLAEQATQNLNTLEDEHTFILMSLDLQWRESIQELFCEMRTKLEEIQNQGKQLKGEMK